MNIVHCKFIAFLLYKTSHFFKKKDYVLWIPLHYMHYFGLIVFFRAAQMLHSALAVLHVAMSERLQWDTESVSVYKANTCEYLAVLFKVWTFCLLSSFLQTVIIACSTTKSPYERVKKKKTSPPLKTVCQWFSLNVCLAYKKRKMERAKGGTKKLSARWDQSQSL